MKLELKKLVAAGTLIMSMLVFTACGSQEAADPEQQDEIQPVFVETVEVGKADISDVSTVNGKLAANVEVSVVPKMAGKVAEVNFDVGDRVHKGDVLVRLESTELQAQLKQAEAALRSAQAGYQDAQKNLARMEQLYQEGAISLQQLEQAQTMLVTGNPDSAAATVELIKAQLANAVVTAPVDGIISSRDIEAGEIAAQMPVMTVVDIDKVLVNTNVAEAEVNRLKVGQEVEVIVSAVQDAPLKGKIAAISPAANAQSSAFPIKIEIANPDHKLKPGMFAEVKLALATKNDAVVIPKEALIDSGDKKTVFKVENDRAVLQEVATGMEDEARIEITKGLKPGEKVVVKGQHKLQDQTPVMENGR